MASIKENIGYNFAYQLLILALPLITAPYLARVIGAQGIGEYSYSYAIATYFVYFVILGLNNYGNRAIAGAQEDRMSRTKLFWSIYCMQILCFIAVAIAYLGYSLLLAGDELVALLQGLYVLSALFDINWFFFGMEQFRLTVLRNTIVKVSTTALIFLLVLDESDVYLYIGIMATGTLVSQIVLWPFLHRYIDLYRPRMQEILVHFRPNILLFASVIAISIYNVLSTIILGVLSGQNMVGFFDSAVKIISVPIALISAIGTVMLPRTSALLSNGNARKASNYIESTMTVVMAFAGVSTFGIASISGPFTIIFYGPDFEPTAIAITILTAKIPLLGFGSVMRTQYLLPQKRDAVFTASAFFGAVVSLCVNITLIPTMGIVGAAFASVAAEVAVLAYQTIRSLREFPVKRCSTIACLFILCGLIMAVILQFIPKAPIPLYECIIKAVVGLAIYCPLATFIWKCVIPKLEL